MLDHALINDTRVNAWFVADAALSVLAGITRMLTLVQGARSRLMLDTSRHLLAVSHTVLANWPSSEILTVLFGVYKAHTACESVASEILSGDAGSMQLDDVMLLERMEGAISTVARQDNDFLPLLQGLRDMFALVKEKMRVGDEARIGDALSR